MLPLWPVMVLVWVVVLVWVAVLNKVMEVALWWGELLNRLSVMTMMHTLPIDHRYVVFESSIALAFI
jgi:hypothetical protein